MSKKQAYLTNEQVLDLNEKHGWFQYGDAQSDVSRAFAQDAIAMHERIRSAAPELLEELQFLVEIAEGAMKESNSDGGEYDIKSILSGARAVIAKATGSVK